MFDKVNISGSNLSLSIMVFDREARLVSANELAEEVLGYPSGFLVPGMKFEDLLRVHAERGEYGEGDIDEQIKERLDFVLRGEPHVFQRRRHDGAVIEARGTPLPDGGFVLTHCDISDQIRAKELRESQTAALIQAERQARYSQERLAEILKIAPEGVISLDKNLVIEFFNKGAERIFGYQSTEVVGRPLEMLIPSRYREAHKQHVDGFVRSDSVYRLMDEREDVAGMRKDGEEFPASASVSKLKDGHEVRYTVMIRDVSERAQAERERELALHTAQEASSAKSQFLASMSHELRTPLNAILGFSEIMRLEHMGPLGSDKYGEYANDIYQSAKHLLSLVNDLLDLSTIEAGKQQLAFESVEFRKLTDDCIRIVGGKAREAGIDLSVDLDDGLPVMWLDERAIKQVLLNLLYNAIKHTPAGGAIELSAETSGPDMLVKVEDTGEGIPPDRIADLLKPFEKGVSDPLQATEGWGLGLAISNSLVKLHQGSLTISSELGRGTSVTVSLPIGARE